MLSFIYLKPNILFFHNQRYIGCKSNLKLSEIKLIVLTNLKFLAFIYTISECIKCCKKNSYTETIQIMASKSYNKRHTLNIYR